MLCPKCKSYQVFVVDSRPKDETTWRRRACESCGYRFNTMELEETEYIALKVSAIAMREYLEDD